MTVRTVARASRLTSTAVALIVTIAGAARLAGQSPAGAAQAGAALAAVPEQSSSSPPAAPTAPAKEGRVTGDAWVSFSIDSGNPLRRFIFDAHGNPYKFVDDKMVMGDAHGTVRFNHPGPDPDGVVRDHWGTVDVDYVMTSGSVAVVSGTSPSRRACGCRSACTTIRADADSTGWASPGVSSTVATTRMGMAPAPFTAYSSGPGYVVTSAELPAIPANAQPPADPPACTEN
jgi:hypothetical protein